MFPAMLVLCISFGNKIAKASAEEQIAGRVTPEMLAVLCLYGLSSAHATLRTLNIIMNIVNWFLFAIALVVTYTAGMIVSIARRYPDTAL